MNDLLPKILRLIKAAEYQLKKLILLIIIGASSIAHSADTCYPPEVVAGKILQGKNVTFSVIEVQGCWIKAVICSGNKCKNNEAYWVHASKVELFKAEIIE